MIRINKDPISAYTHLAGFVAAVVGLVVLLVVSAGAPAKTVAMALYGGTLALLFLASGSYHLLDLGERGNRLLRRLDHSAIFLFIAGTYMPPLIHTLDGAWRISMVAVMGGLAVAGVVLKMFWIASPRWLTTTIYLVMGWVVLVPLYQIVQHLTPAGIAWMVAGGLIYSAGAVVYARKKPDPLPGVFGFHEVWHLFVLAGALAHFLFVWTMVDQPYPPFGR